MVGDGEIEFNTTPKRGWAGPLTAPGALVLEAGSAVTLKSQHWQQQRFGFRSHCISIEGQLCLCFILSGTLADEEVSGISLISWEKEESWTTKH